MATTEDLTHKGYSGSIVPSLEDDCLHGRILFIDDLITYEANTILEIRKEFIKAVDEYIEYCDKTGRPANKPYSGNLNTRIGASRHRMLAELAHRNKTSINVEICKSIDYRATEEVRQEKQSISEDSAGSLVFATASRGLKPQYTVAHIVSKLSAPVIYNRATMSFGVEPEEDLFAQGLMGIGGATTEVVTTGLIGSSDDENDDLMVREEFWSPQKLISHG